MRSTVLSISAITILVTSNVARADVPPGPMPLPPPEPAPQPAPEPTQPQRPPGELSAPTEYEEQASEEPSARTLTAAYYTGFRWGISPGVAFVDGNAAFALSLYLGYGFDTGSVIFVPGATIASIFSANTFVYATPELRLVYPIGMFAPFISGGAGPGFTTSPSQGAFVVRGGGGFTVHPSAKFAIGIEGGYMAYVGLNSAGPYIGPILSFAF